VEAVGLALLCRRWVGVVAAMAAAGAVVAAAA